MLPDISGLAKLDREALRALRTRLLEVVTLAAVADSRAPFAAVPTVLAERLKAQPLRRRSDASSRAIRLFMFGDRVTVEEAEHATGDLFGALLDAGLLRRDGDGVEGLFDLGRFNDTLIFSDRLQGEEGVMGFGATTVALAKAAYPTKPIRTALDVGCGAGTVALVLAPATTRVVGVDIDPRAIEIARFNARLNGVTNAEFRVGDLLAPVAGEQFDVVVSQPPFLATPDGTEAKPMSQGRRRGDELALRLFGGLTKVLARGGLAVTRIDWLVTEPAAGERPGAAGVLDRVRAALGPELDLTVVTPPPIGLEGYCATYAATVVPTLGEAFVAEFARRREHFERVGGLGVLTSLTIAHRSGASPGASLLRFAQTEGTVTPEAVRAIVDARELARDDKKLLAAKLYVPVGTTLTEEQDGPGSEVPSRMRARFVAAALTLDLEIDTRLLFVLTAVHEQPTVQAAIDRYAAEAEMATDEALEIVLPAVRDALLKGALTTQAP